MNLAEALHTVNGLSTVLGNSDAALATRVCAATGAGLPPLHPAPPLHGLQPLRLADMLLRLAQATSPLYEADVYDRHAYWAQLRYLGIFTRDWSSPHARVHLSDAGQRVVGNQRRVMSEELGIGFAVLFAERWMRTVYGGGGIYRTVDADLALTEGSIATARGHKTVKALGTHRPDYVLLLQDPGTPHRTHIGLLECKGTKSAAHSIRQLAHASAQLSAFEVGGRRYPGLAVSTVLAAQRLYANSLEFRPSSLASRGSRWDIPGGPGETQAVLGDAVEVDVELLANPGPRPNEDPLQAVARTAIQASMAFLADFVGNTSAARSWAPPNVRSRLERRPQVEASRVVAHLSDGTPVTGLRQVLQAPEGPLEMVLGVPSDLDEALTANNPYDVLGIQSQIATERAPRLNGGQPDGPFMVETMASDGATLILRPY